MTCPWERFRTGLRDAGRMGEQKMTAAVTGMAVTAVTTGITGDTTVNRARETGIREQNRVPVSFCLWQKNPRGTWILLLKFAGLCDKVF